MTQRHWWCYVNKATAWRRAVLESRKRGIAHAIIKNEDGFYVFNCDGMSDYHLIYVVSGMMRGKFIRRTFVLR